MAGGFGGESASATIGGLTLTGEAVGIAADICAGITLGSLGILLAALTGGAISTVKFHKKNVKEKEHIGKELIKILKEKNLTEGEELFNDFYKKLLNEDATRETINAKNDALSNANDALADAKTQANDLKQKAQDEAQQKIEDAKAKVEQAKNEVEIAKAERREELAKTQVGAGTMTQQNASVEFTDSLKSILMELAITKQDGLPGSEGEEESDVPMERERLNIRKNENETAQANVEAKLAKIKADEHQKDADRALKAAGNINKTV